VQCLNQLRNHAIAVNKFIIIIIIIIIIISLLLGSSDGSNVDFYSKGTRVISPRGRAVGK